MPQIDLNERRKLKQATTVRAGKRTYTLPVFMPASMMGAMLKLADAPRDPAAGIAGIREVYALLFGKQHVDEAMADIGLIEMQQIVEEAYGITVPQSLASVNS